MKYINIDIKKFREGLMSTNPVGIPEPAIPRQDENINPEQEQEVHGLKQQLNEALPTINFGMEEIPLVPSQPRGGGGGEFPIMEEDMGGYYEDEESPMMQQGGIVGNPPIYVDPSTTTGMDRYQAYNDSLKAYNLGNRMISEYNAAIKKGREKGTPLRTLPNTSNRLTPYPGTNILPIESKAASPTGTPYGPIGNDSSLYVRYSRWKKPEQPIEFQKEKESSSTKKATIKQKPTQPIKVKPPEKPIQTIELPEVTVRGERPKPRVASPTLEKRITTHSQLEQFKKSKEYGMYDWEAIGDGAGGTLNLRGKIKATPVEEFRNGGEPTLPFLVNPSTGRTGNQPIPRNTVDNNYLQMLNTFGTPSDGTDPFTQVPNVELEKFRAGLPYLKNAPLSEVKKHYEISKSVRQNQPATISQEYRTPQILDRDAKAAQLMQNEKLGIMDLPLTILNNPLGAVGEALEASGFRNQPFGNYEQERSRVMQNRYNPYFSDEQRLASTLQQASELGTGAALNLGLTGALMPKASAGRILGESLLPFGSVDDIVNPLSNIGRKAKSNITSSVDDVGKGLTQTPQASKTWQMQELPGLHLKSTMEGEAISKIVEPKTGLINTEQALAIIGKESGGADKVALIRQGLGDNIPKKMDYNDFRKTVQDQLIPLERQFATHSSGYGIDRLGYYKQGSVPKYSESYLNQEINKINSILEQQRLGKIKMPDSEIQGLNNKLNDYKRHLSGQSFPEYIENQTMILGSKSKFGKGSSAHGNPDETLGHAHFLRDAETPDVLTVTQIQSDAFQGTHRIMPSKNPEINKWEKMLTPEARKQLIKDGGEEAADLVQEGARKFLKDFEKKTIGALGPNPTQKQLLDKNHQERYLQELVDYAGKRGDVNKVRVPTSETAAKVQGYNSNKVLNRKLYDAKVEELKLSGKYTDNEIKNMSVRLRTNPDYFTPSFLPEHQTILKKYAEQPKTIKKLFGKEPTVVTDSKGNTWYEFDIPDKFKKGKGEIKAFGLAPFIGIGGSGALNKANKGDKNKTN
jgi:hypothetical protein